MSEQMMSPLKQKRAILEQKRAANKRAAEEQQAKREEARLDAEIAYEEARASAYQKHGADRVIGGEIQGAGFVVLRWPDQIAWRYFVNKGILKKDKLTDELCAELVTRCLEHPGLADYQGMVARNPNANVKLATMIIDAMRGGDEDEGK